MFGPSAASVAKAVERTLPLMTRRAAFKHADPAMRAKICFAVRQSDRPLATGTYVLGQTGERLVGDDLGAALLVGTRFFGSLSCHVSLQCLDGGTPRDQRRHKADAILHIAAVARKVWYEFDEEREGCGQGKAPDEGPIARMTTLEQQPAKANSGRVTASR